MNQPATPAGARKPAHGEGPASAVRRTSATRPAPRHREIRRRSGPSWRLLRRGDAAPGPWRCGRGARWTLATRAGPQGDRGRRQEAPTLARSRIAARIGVGLARRVGTAGVLGQSGVQRAGMDRVGLRDKPRKAVEHRQQQQRPQKSPQGWHVEPPSPDAILTRGARTRIDRYQVKGRGRSRCGEALAGGATGKPRRPHAARSRGRARSASLRPILQTDGPAWTDSWFCGRLDASQGESGINQPRVDATGRQAHARVRHQ